MGVTATKLEYGDYQTPSELAASVCRVLKHLGMQPRSLVEPTCGIGAFLRAGVDTFPGLLVALGFEINARYVEIARHSMAGRSGRISPARIEIEHADCFATDWAAVLGKLPEPILVLGNPPWVTNAALGCVGSGNLPMKSNFQGHTGLDAITGKGNFDISESMLIRLCEALQGRRATIAMLCKKAVARKLMSFCWKRRLMLADCHLFPIDAQREFDAAVDACLFVGHFHGRGFATSCQLHDRLCETASIAGGIGYRDGLLIADMEAYEQWRFAQGASRYTWRSGVKHDCAKVMEFTERDGSLVNGLGEKVEIEDTFLYPLRKSSALAGSPNAVARKVLVTQKCVGGDTASIAQRAPKTWAYLLANAGLLDRRASAIYRKRARFSVFGVGEYSFSQWKVAISGFHKRLEFCVVGPENGRPVMLDDTAYHLACRSEAEALYCVRLLNSEPARGLLSSLIFWDAKRPVTVEVLRQLSLENVARYFGEEWELFAAREPSQVKTAVEDAFADPSG